MSEKFDSKGSPADRNIEAWEIQEAMLHSAAADIAAAEAETVKAFTNVFNSYTKLLRALHESILTHEHLAETADSQEMKQEASERASNFKIRRGQLLQDYETIKQILDRNAQQRGFLNSKEEAENALLDINAGKASE